MRLSMPFVSFVFLVVNLTATYAAPTRDVYALDVVSHDPQVRLAPPMHIPQAQAAFNSFTIELNGKTLTLAPLASGTRGEVFTVEGGFDGKDAVAKRNKDGSAMDKEVTNSKAAQAHLDSGTASDSKFYIILKHIKGVPVYQTLAAQQAQKEENCETFMVSARKIAAKKALEYALEPYLIKHNDLALPNVLYSEGVDDEDSDNEGDLVLKFADFIDWGEATTPFKAMDPDDFKGRVIQSLEGTPGFRDSDCKDNWENAPKVRVVTPHQQVPQVELNSFTIELNGKTLTLTPLDTGTQGEAFTVEGGFDGKDAVAKRSKDGSSMDDEVTNSKAAQAYFDSGTASDSRFYIILKKVDGVPVYMTLAAQQAQKEENCATFMVSARKIAAKKSLEYASKPYSIKHNDLALPNVFYLEGQDEDGDLILTFADFIDWGKATTPFEAMDPDTFKAGVIATLETTLGFRDVDCEQNWEGVPKVQV